MQDVISILLVVTAVVCMLLAQRKTTARITRRNYALLGSAASFLIAVEAFQHNEHSALMIFALATMAGLLAAWSDIKPSTDA